jgi:hypothetical protein
MRKKTPKIIDKCIENENIEDAYSVDGRVPHVIVEGEWVDFSKTEFIDISEDIFGIDLYSFSYKGKKYQSYVTYR